LSLPRLLDDDDDVCSCRWAFAIVTIEQSGWVTLPARARTVVPACGSLRLSSRGEVAVLRAGGGGRVVVVGGRGRIIVPCWLRDAARPDGSLLVATGAAADGGPIVLLAPPRLLCGFADAMVGER
jgi:hypothetical protein